MSVVWWHTASTKAWVHSVSGCEVIASSSIEAGYPNLDRREGVAKSGKRSDPHEGNGLKRLEDRLVKSSSPQNFPSYVRENFDRFHRLILAIGRRADKWEIIAQWWVDDKEMVGNKPINPDAARRAYERIRSERMPKKPSTKPPVESSQGMARDSMDTLAASLGNQSARVLTTRTAATPSIRVIDQFPPKDAEETTADASETLARLKRQMDERSGFNPKKKD